MVTLGTQNRELGNILNVVNNSSENHKNELLNIKNIYSLTTQNIKNDIDVFLFIIRGKPKRHTR